MKVWITKYALSRGVYEAEVEETNQTGMVVHRQEGLYPAYYQGEGTDWHRTEEAAKTRASAMAKAKIASLKKQISKLEKLTF